MPSKTKTSRRAILLNVPPKRVLSTLGQLLLVLKACPLNQVGRKPQPGIERSTPSIFNIQNSQQNVNLESQRHGRTYVSWLDEIERKLDYGRWYAGHFHTTKAVDKLRLMYQDYARLGE